MNLKLSILALLFFPISLIAQIVEFAESGHLFQESFTCNQESIHEKYFAETQYVKDSLISNDILTIKHRKSQDDHVLLDWPVAQNINYNEPDYYGISNYVDHNASYPNQIQDYNCGSMSYDLSNGYNHAGIDIFSSPFPWMKMNNNQVIAVAAASGVIVYKVGSNFDKNCDFNNSEGWNAVYVAHEDGSTAWYGHLKENSLTRKTVGESVTTGEYLGVIGSSGSSTGPHLHFELYDFADQLVDPYVGPCNPTTSTSWWRDQKTYKDSRILKLMTHDISPIPYGCYGEEMYNAEINFSTGQNVLLATYLADQTIGDFFYHRLIQPDGSVYDEWEQEFEDNFVSSYWYYSLGVTSNLPKGKWMYQVVYENQEIVSHNFYIKESSDQAVLSAPLNLIVDSEASYYTFDIENTGNVGLNIQKIIASDALIADWEGDIAPGKSKEILVQLKLDIEEEAEVIEIYHNANNSPKVIYVSKNLVSIVNSTISELEFGEVMIEVNDTLKLPIDNQGLGTLQIQDITLPAGFEVNRNSYEIEAQKTGTLEVYFQPTNEINYGGKMKIISNAVNNGSLEIDLSGKGITNIFLSNDERLSEGLKIFPNPTINELNINFELIDQSICSFSIIDVSGKTLLSSSIDKDAATEYKLDVGALPSGVYFVKLNSNSNSEIYKKFVKR